MFVSRDRPSHLLKPAKALALSLEKKKTRGLIQQGLGWWMEWSIKVSRYRRYVTGKAGEGLVRGSFTSSS